MKTQVYLKGKSEVPLLLLCFLSQSCSVLECGAGAGLPSLVACLNEAAKVLRLALRLCFFDLNSSTANLLFLFPFQVIITDFPDEDLISNLRDNVARNIPDLLQSRVTVLGHMWGKDPHLLLQALPGHPNAKFDVIILSVSAVSLIIYHNHIYLSHHHTYLLVIYFSLFLAFFLP